MNRCKLFTLISRFNQTAEMKDSHISKWERRGRINNSRNRFMSDFDRLVFDRGSLQLYPVRPKTKGRMWNASFTALFIYLFIFDHVCTFLKCLFLFFSKGLEYETHPPALFTRRFVQNGFSYTFISEK